MTEPQLLKLFTSEVQKNFEKFQDTCFFFKLKYVKNKKSKIIWQQTFDTNNELINFYFDNKFMRTAIMLKFRKNHYEVLCLGFCFSDRFEIWPDITLNHLPEMRQTINRENFSLPPKELLERGFGEITDELD